MVIMAILLPYAAIAAPFAAYVMDGRTGKELYSQNAHTRVHPASLTKMMTLYMAFTAVERRQVSLDTKFTVSTNAAGKPPSKLGLRAGQQIELRYLIRAAAIKSANDAATVIAEGLAGSEAAFGQQMTAMAQALGMRNTRFLNAHGLTQEGHYSSAYDMSVLGRHLFYDHPQYYNIFSRRSADAGVATVSSTNRRFLDSYEGADGIKTGYTRAAGFNLTASAQRGRKRIIATVMGGTSTAHRNSTMSQLLDIGFSKAPNRAREVKPTAPVLVAEPRRRTVQVARTEPAPVAPVVLNRSAAPQPAAPARDGLAEALGAAMASTAGLEVAATPASAGSLGLAASIRPAIRPEGSVPDMADVSAEAAVVASAPSGQGLASSMRPPRNKRTVLSAADQAVGEVRQAAQASTFRSEDIGTESLGLTASAPPEPRRETVILAAMSSREASAQATETISRGATSAGGRGWGVSLGLQTSRQAAEQLLLQTALQENAVLDRASRNVADTRRGFDPRFVGMTQGEARLACDKLWARTMTCEIIGG